MLLSSWALLTMEEKIISVYLERFEKEIERVQRTDDDEELYNTFGL